MQFVCSINNSTFFWLDTEVVKFVDYNTDAICGLHNTNSTLRLWSLWITPQMQFVCSILNNNSTFFRLDKVVKFVDYTTDSICL